MKKCTIFAGALLAFAFGVVRPVVAADVTPQEKFSQATALLQAHKYAEALPLFDELKVSYPTSSVYWNLGLTAFELGDNTKSLQAWLAVRQADPNKWQARSKLIQTYQALGDVEARDRERTALIDLWKAGTDATLSGTPIFCREIFHQEGHKIMALEYFNPSGPKMVIYSFNVLNDTDQPDYKISLGSYDTTNQVALELGERPKDKRIYHLDLYRGNTHATYGLFLGQPSYDEIRRAVVDVLSGKSKPISSSVMPVAS